MDYESRKVKWYWLTLFIFYSGFVIYLIFKGNPLLYSHLELRSALTAGDPKNTSTVPSSPRLVDKPGESASIARYNLARTAIDPIGAPRAKNYEEHVKHALNLDIPDFDIQHISQDRTGFYFTGSTPWAIAVNLDGTVRWKYKFRTAPVERPLHPILVDDKTAYLIHPAGGIAALDKNTGAIRWVLHLKQDVVAAPLLWNDHILLPTKNPSGVQLRLLRRSNGKMMDESPVFEVKVPNIELTYSDTLKLLLMTAGNKILAINPLNWSAQ